MSHFLNYPNNLLQIRDRVSFERDMRQFLFETDELCVIRSVPPDTIVKVYVTDDDVLHIRAFHRNMDVHLYQRGELLNINPEDWHVPSSRLQPERDDENVARLVMYVPHTANDSGRKQRIADDFKILDWVEFFRPVEKRQYILELNLSLHLFNHNPFAVRRLLQRD